MRLADIENLKFDFSGLKHISPYDGIGISEFYMKQVKALPTIDPETLPIVQELREKLKQTKQELRNVKYCYGIAKNGEKQLRRQVNEVTAEWAECVKKLERVTAERDAAVSDLENIIAYNTDTCQFCKNNQCYVRGGTKPCLPKWRGPDGDRS